MKLRGEDVASSIRDWLKEDIKKGPSSKHELGKFFLGASTGTLGLFVTLLKFAIEKPALDWLTACCFSSLLISIIIALYMSVPYVVRVKKDIELYSKYNKIIRTIVGLIIGWFVFWVVGFSFGVIKLFSSA